MMIFLAANERREGEGLFSGAGEGGGTGDREWRGGRWGRGGKRIRLDAGLQF